jgi:hypothetical protein
MNRAESYLQRIRDILDEAGGDPELTRKQYEGLCTDIAEETVARANALQEDIVDEQDDEE